MKKLTLTLTILLAMLTASKAWAYNGMLIGDGSCTNPYMIKDIADWNMFANLLNDPVYAPYYCDKHFRLGADIGSESTNPGERVTTWASNDSRYPFCGTFDGNGHTIWIKYVQTDSNVNPNDDSSQGVALFHYADHGCEIHDLIIKGEIITNYKYAAAFISYIPGGDSYNNKYVSVDRCTTYVDIVYYDTFEGDACSGGFVGYSGHYVFLNFKDCLFRGTYRGASVSGVCGMVGYQANDGWVYFEDCYVNPTSLYIHYTDNDHNFCNYGYDLGGIPCYSYHDSFYENPGFGDEQGELTILDYITPEVVVSLLGNWTVVDGQPIPMTINMVEEHCSLFSGYYANNSNIPYNSNYSNTNEDYGKVVDGNKATKWCVMYPYSWHNSWTPISVYFDYGKGFIPKGYIVTTGNDVEAHPDRLPKEWELYGWNGETNDWDLLDHHTSKSGSLPKKNVVDRAFLLNNYENITRAYNYFWLKIEEIEREDEYWNGFFGGGWVTNEADFVCELSEIRIFGVLSENDQHDLANCAISGLLPYYEHTGSAIPLHYMVTDYYGDELVEGPGSHYTKTITRKYGDLTENVTEVIGSGEYTFTITGQHSFHGTQTTSFVVTDPGLPDPMVWTNDGNNTYYYVKIPATGCDTLDLSSDVRPFTEPFYVFDDGGPNMDYSPNCDGKLVIIAPEGYVLQVEGHVCSEGYPGDYLVIYDGDDVDDAVLGDNSYGTKATQSVPLLNTTGRDMLLNFISNNVYNTFGMQLLVTPISTADGHDIIIPDVDNGEVTTAQTEDVLINTDVVLNINPDNGYMLQSITATVDSKKLTVDGGLWYLNDPDTQDDETATATFTMPGSDVNITPIFAATDSLSVNMPYNINDPTDAMQVYIPEEVVAFNVYNSNGKDGGYNTCTVSYLQLNAPEGKILQISGITNVDEGDYLEVFDGNNLNNSMGYGDMDNRDIGVLVSSGNQVLLLFVSDSWNNWGGGIDITVRPLDPEAFYTIPTITVTGGTITPNKPTAKFGENVNLQIEPSNGYMLNELKVTQHMGDNDYEMAVTGGLWHDTNPTEASFVMPANNVAITPSFTDNLTSGDDGLYINMPKYNRSYEPKKVNLSTHITSFKVYDNGGKDGNYSPYCDGYMVLTAPIGYRLSLSGNVTCQNKGTYHDFLKVYDGDTVTAPPIGNPDGFGYSDPGLDFGPLTSTGRSMMLYFHSENNSMRGLDLTVEVVNEIPYKITFDDTNVPANCSLSISGYENIDDNGKYIAWVGDIITVDVNCDDNHLFEGLSVKDPHGNEIALSQGMAWYDGNNTEATFTMPARNLTITYEFVEKGSQYVNMPKLNTVQTPLEVTVPEGITSFKIYDDGGANDNYSNDCFGYMLLTAPEGKAWQLSGTVKSEFGKDYMVVYDGDTTERTLGFNRYGNNSDNGENISGLVTFSDQMLIRFHSDYQVNYEGLDLTATVIDPITRIVKGYGSNTDFGSWDFISAPTKYYIFPEKVTNLIPTTNGEPDPMSDNYDLYRYNQSAELEWENYKAHMNSFTLNRGCGYLYANRYQQTLHFGGEVNIGDSITVPLVYDANAGVPGVNLVGNPLLFNAYVNRPYYMMSDDGRDIEPVYDYTRWPVQMCTGIVVCADDENETVSFSKTEPTSKALGEGALLVTLTKTDTPEEEHDRAFVTFREGLKLRKFIFNKEHAKVFIPKDGKNYAITYSEKTGEMPLSLKAVYDGAYTLTVNPVIAQMEYLHLIDNLTGADVDLLANPVYSFTANAGEFDSRFRLMFSAYSIDENGATTGSATFAYIDASGNIIITDGPSTPSTGSGTSGTCTLQVIDILGRQCYTKELSTANCQLSTANFPAGVYVLRLINGNEVRTQKIVIE